jgi:hypothetical protein
MRWPDPTHSLAGQPNSAGRLGLRVTPLGSGEDKAGPSGEGENVLEGLVDDGTLQCAICHNLCVRPVTVSSFGLQR